ncbi:hypothetical protein HNP55_003731 [Paucibacter oligotrophus]|uniref:Ice-binding protein C-terminal domain-containing protein n=1 Tax=Roseateles oligotrophus TaxID=1769250 RepID=A0A840L9C5_9BURK|nr:PEP-CTERM sorting domain-containing protein [Roseateles oligotrophus]MBB4845184.1 hypothetical protein [Roseateles oligotrophus]
MSISIPSKWRPKLRQLSLATSTLILCQSAQALDYLWLPYSGDWENAANWSLLGLPGGQDRVEFTGGSARLSSTTSIQRLRMNSGGAQIYGTGTLTTAELDMQRGILGGGGAISAVPVGATVVSGSASFNGAETQAVNTRHTLTLQGNSNWTTGNGALGGGGAIINASSATFNDLGAGSSNSYRALRDSGGSYSGGIFVNQGSYVRSGLGLTRAYGFDNQGSLALQSGTFELREQGRLAGQTRVAEGALLAFNGSGTTLLGNIDNQGRMHFRNGRLAIEASATLGGVVEVSDAQISNQSSNSLQRLTLNSGGAQIYGTGTLTTAELDMQRGILGGGGAISAVPVGATVVSGNASFNGAGTQAVNTKHTLTLQGNSNWTAGNGALGGGGAIINASGATFNDLGTSNSNSYKALRDSGGSYSGGIFVNQGSYVRSGLGLTRAYGFDNQGSLDLQAGSFQVDGHFSNTGSIHIASEAVLASDGSQFNNVGLIQGSGTIKTWNANSALNHAGTLDPGEGAKLGTLSVDGSLSFGKLATLRIDLGQLGQSDLLRVSKAVSLDGELSLWAAPDLVLHAGDSYTLVSFDQRLNASTFQQISWHGLDTPGFTLEYNAHDIVLRVSAVPEPESWALLLAGLGLLAIARSRPGKIELGGRNEMAKAQAA